MSGDIDLDDLLGPEPDDPDDPDAEILVDEAPKSRPMGEASLALLKRSRSYPVNGPDNAAANAVLGIRAPRRPRKNTPENLKRLLSYVAEMPVASDAARRIGIDYSTLKYWLQRSLEGRPGDGFDMVLGDGDESANEDDTIRFHEAWDSAMLVGVGRVETATIRRASGYDEALTYQGRVKYKLDPERVTIARMLGDPEDSAECYLLDQFGAPVPETVWKMDPDLAMFILKTRRPDVYGNKATVDVNVRGGVLVVGMKLDKPEDLPLLEDQYRREGLPPVIFDDAEDDE
jgi:hypothetical protein